MNAPTKLALLIDTNRRADVTRADTLPPPGRIGLTDHHPIGEFSEAVLAHGQTTQLIGLVADRASASDFQRLYETHVKDKRKLNCQVSELSRFHDDFLPSPPSHVLHMAGFLDARFAWARQRDRPTGFALCGVANHALCQPMVLEEIGKLVTAPFEPFDALVCTSQAVKKLIRMVADGYAANLAERHGGSPKLQPRLEVIPRGVDPDAFHPATPAERSERRRALDILPDELVVISAGPLSFHRRANPYPIYNGLYQAARATKRKIHLLLTGSAANSHIRKAFLDGARVFAPTVKTTVIDNSHPASGRTIWHAADLFALMPDNVMESCDVTLIQAMACGLPVVTSDWAGCRDIVLDGKTGVLIPTRIVDAAISDVTSRLLLNEFSFDSFLAQTSQTIAVDCSVTTQAFTQLIRDDDLRQKFGLAGRERVLKHFTWECVIRAFDQLWHEQESDCTKQAKKPAPRKRGRKRVKTTPAAPEARLGLFPPIESCFGGYPSQLLGDEDHVRANPEMETRLYRLLNIAMTQYEPHIRSADPKLLRESLDAAAEPCTIASLDALLRQAGLSRRSGRATITWLLKYGLLEPTMPG